MGEKNLIKSNVLRLQDIEDCRWYQL